MKHRPGLTLLEMLLATAILSLVAATCVPLLREAIDTIQRPGPPAADLDELASMADRFLADPSVFGADSVQEIEDFEFAWPDDDQHRSIRVRRLATSDDEADHEWLVFESNGRAVMRWLKLENKEQEAQK